VRHGGSSFLRAAPAPEPGAVAGTPARAMLDTYCVTCHNDKLKTAGLSLQAFDLADVGRHADIGEKVVRKLRSG